MSSKITLKQYIEARGVHTVATLCRVTTSTVYNWAKMDFAPMPLYAHLMIDDSMGMLSFDSIYSQYISKNFHLVSAHKNKDFNDIDKG